MTARERQEAKPWVCFASFLGFSVGAWHSITKCQLDLLSHINSYSLLKLPNLFALWKLHGKDELQKLISELVRDFKGLTERLSAGLRLRRIALSGSRDGCCRSHPALSPLPAALSLGSSANRGHSWPGGQSTTWKKQRTSLM